MSGGDDGRAAEAERALKIGTVLSTGGFPDEVGPHLGKALRGCRVDGEAGDVVADPAADANLRRLIDMAALPENTLRVLDAVNPGTVSPQSR